MEIGLPLMIGAALALYAALQKGGTRQKQMGGAETGRGRRADDDRRDGFLSVGRGFRC